MSAPRSVLLAGGGTAGHVSPLLATAAAIHRRYPDARLTALGSHGGMEERLVPEAGLDLRLIDKVAFPRRPDLAALRFPVAFPRAVKEARAVLEDVEADVVVGFGGYVCPPAFVAARGRLPIVLHEGNAIPGMANKLGRRWTSYAAKTFPATPFDGELIGMPLRRTITQLDRAAVRAEALAELGLEAGHPTVLVTGGSLGARSINQAFQDAAARLSEAGVQVLHVTGRGNLFDAPQRSGSQAPYVVREYMDRMDLAYAAADLVVTRSGGGMVCETSAVGLPAVFVPLPVGNGEQRKNAAEVVEAGGAVLVDDGDMTAQYVTDEVLPLLLDSSRLDQMGAQAYGVGRRDADERMVDLLERALEGGVES